MSPSAGGRYESLLTTFELYSLSTKLAMANVAFDKLLTGIGQCMSRSENIATSDGSSPHSTLIA